MIQQGDLVRIKSLKDLVFVFESMCVSAKQQQDGVFILQAIVRPTQSITLSGVTLRLSDSLVVDADKIELDNSFIR